MTNSFLGIPISGTIVRGEHSVPQRPLEEFTPLIQAVLDDENVSAFGWQQYTPYFNDGEPCVFGANGLWAAPQGRSRSEDEDPYESTFHVEYGSIWGGYRNEIAPELEDTRERLRTLNTAIERGEFDDVLLDAFGDHAEITVRRDGITVESYSHE